MNISISKSVSLSRFIVLLQIILLLMTASACKAQKPPIPKALQDYLNNQGVQETVIDLDYTSPTVADKRYVSITVTYNFSTSSGKPQKEYLGFILKSDGGDWQIDRHTTYTVNEQKAKDLLAGNLK